jgi:hypothetical protein
MVTEGMDMTDDVRAALAALDDMTREACAAYDAAAKEYERASMAAALTLVRRALAAEAEVTRLRAENDVLRKSTDAAVDGVRAMLPEALKVAREEGEAAAREWAANVCERMVVGGCAWSEEQAIAGRALLAAAESIRTLPIDACAEVKQ